MARKFRSSCAAAAVMLVWAGAAGAQGLGPRPGTLAGPRHNVPAVAPEDAIGTAPGVRPGPMYPQPNELRPQQHQAPTVGSAVNDLYKDPLQKFYRNPAPAGGGGNAIDPATRNALRQLYGDKVPLSRPSVPDGPPSAASANAAPRGFPRYDLNGDGAVTADEYSAAQMRAAPGNPTPAAAARRQRLMERFNSRFRAADRNGDGRVTPAELDADPNARF